MCRSFWRRPNALEVWDGNELVSGGKHYGHLEIDAIFNADGKWDVSLTPVYAFPILSKTNPGEIIDWERRVYDDTVTFTSAPEPGTGLLVLSGIAAGLLVRHRRRRHLSRVV